MDLKAGLADQTVSFAAWTTTTGSPVTVTSATAGLSLWYRRGVAGAKVAISPSDLALLTTAHTDGGILVIEGAEHRLDLPDAATAAGVASVAWGGTATGITIDGGSANLIGQANSASDVSHVGGTDQTEGDIIASIGAIGSGTGARTVTITVNDGTNPLEAAKVRVEQGAESYMGATNASGEVTFHLDDATWAVTITKPLYTHAGASLVVNGNETQTYSMTAVTITPPSSATLCTVQFRVKLSDTAVSGAVCKAKLQGINQASDGTILSNEESSDTTDAQGIAELQLVQKGSIVKGSGVYKIWVEIDGKPVASVETVIPNQSTYLFEDLL